MREEQGSNLWAIGPSRTRDRTAMLFVNPHQPWFGPGQTIAREASIQLASPSRDSGLL